MRERERERGGARLLRRRIEVGRGEMEATKERTREWRRKRPSWRSSGEAGGEGGGLREETRERRGRRIRGGGLENTDHGETSAKALLSHSLSLSFFARVCIYMYVCLREEGK